MLVERFKQFIREHKWSMVVFAAALIIVAVFGWAVCREGIWYKDVFLYRQAENVWSGTVLGEETTITRTVEPERVWLEIRCESGKKTFTVEGKSGYGEQIRLLEDGNELFVGSFVSGLLFDENGEPHNELGIIYSTGGEEYYDDGTGDVKHTPLHLSKSAAVSLALELEETTRGMPFMILFELLVVAVFFVELWWPQIFFRWEVGRFVSGDAEPSDEYLARRTLGLIMTAGLFFVMIGMSFIH